MNVSKFEGEFPSCQALVKALVKKYLQYDYILEADEMASLEYQGLSIRITQNNKRLLISANGNDIDWDINELVLQNEFPQKILVGQLNKVVNLPLLSEKLKALKEVIQQQNNPTTTKNSNDTEKIDQTSNPTSDQTVQPSSQFPESPQQHPYISGMPSYIDQKQHHIQNPFSIGNSDLDPFSAGSVPGGSMIMGPDHPLFDRRGDNGNGTFGNPTGMFPPGSVPPGARFDPVSPFDINIRPGHGGYHGPPGGNFGPFNPVYPGYGKPTRPEGIPGYNGGFSVGPTRTPRPGHPSGDPDFDELIPPRFEDEFM